MVTRKIKLNELKTLIGEIIKEEMEEYKSEPSNFSDFKGRDLTITRKKDGSLLFEFDSMGWLFDTTDIGEGAAIIANSKLKNEEGIKNIKITNTDKSNYDSINALYWLTGGKRAWESGDKYTESFDEVEDELKITLGIYVDKIIKDSNTLGEVIEKMLELKNNEEFKEDFFTIVSYVDDEE